MNKEEAAYLAGYRVDVQGRVFNPKGEQLKVTSKGNKRYPQVNFKHEGKKYYVRMHRLAAYCFYGSEIYNDGVLVRHLNDNKEDISLGNIRLGTQKENMGDISDDKKKEMNTKKRKYALENEIKPPRILKIEDSEIPEILGLLDSGKTHREIARIFGVHHSTVGYINKTRRYTYENNRCS